MGNSSSYEFKLDSKPDDKHIEFADSTYIGSVQNDIPHGEGMMVYEDGSIYKGQWSSGKKSGYGLIQYADNRVYNGQWKDDIIYGQGEMLCNNGERVVGSFFDGKMLGQGVHYYADGTTAFCGTFHMNLYKNGTAYYSNGSKYYSGGWYADMEHMQSYPHGMGKLYDEIGNLLQSGRFNMGYLVESDQDAQSTVKKPGRSHSETDLSVKVANPLMGLKK